MESIQRKIWMEEESLLSIIQWNCRSIKKNTDRKEELKDLLRKRKPHVCCVSETWFDDSVKTQNIAGYSKTYRKDRPNGGGGGLIMLVRDDIKTKNVNLNLHQRSIIEAHAIEVTVERNKIKLLHIYNPETSLDIRDFKNIVDQIGRNYIIVG